MLQATNAIRNSKLGSEAHDESVRFLARYNFLYRRAGLNVDEARAKRLSRSIWYLLTSNFASGMGVCAGIVEPFKHILHETAHPLFLLLELRSPMGACPDNTVYHSKSWGFILFLYKYLLNGSIKING